MPEPAVAKSDAGDAPACPAVPKTASAATRASARLAMPGRLGGPDARATDAPARCDGGRVPPSPDKPGLESRMLRPAQGRRGGFIFAACQASAGTARSTQPRRENAALQTFQAPTARASLSRREGTACAIKPRRGQATGSLPARPACSALGWSLLATLRLLCRRQTHAATAALPRGPQALQAGLRLASGAGSLGRSRRPACWPGPDAVRARR